MAQFARTVLLIGVVVPRARVRALFSAAVVKAFTDLDVNPVRSAILAPGMALPTYLFARQRLENSFLLRMDVFVVVSVRTGLVGSQALLQNGRIVRTDDGFLARVARMGSDGVVRARASINAVLVAW